MSTVLRILFDVVLPIVVLMGTGVVADRWFRPDLRTLSKLNFYLFAPALVFVKLYEQQLDGSFIARIMGFNAVHMLVLLALCWVVFRLPRLREHRALLTMGALFNNSGNYGLPFAQLAFGDAGVTVMALVLIFQNITSFTLGLWLIGDERQSVMARLGTMVRTPMVMALCAAALCSLLHVRLPQPVMFPLTQLGYALVPMALFTLGVQLARAEWLGTPLALTAVTLARLVAAPLLALLMALVWVRIDPGAPADALPVLVCAAGLPVAVNVTILAIEYHHDAELASRMVFWTTVFSTLTIAVWLALYVA